MPSLIWAHWGFAGISNLYESDFWGSDVTCTSSRGFSGALPIAESVIGAILMFTRQLHLAVLQTANQEFDTCITLRTALIKDKKIYVQSGAGIVADSNPEKEYNETVNKAKALLKAIN